MGETGDYCESQPTGTETARGQPVREPGPAEENLNWHGPIAGVSERTSLRVRNSRQIPHFCEFYLWEFNQVLIVNTEGKNRCSASRRDKGTI